MVQTVLYLVWDVLLVRCVMLYIYYVLCDSIARCWIRYMMYVTCRYCNFITGHSKALPSENGSAACTGSWRVHSRQTTNCSPFLCLQKPSLCLPKKCQMWQYQECQGQVLYICGCDWLELISSTNHRHVCDKFKKYLYQFYAVVE